MHSGSSLKADLKPFSGSTQLAGMVLEHLEADRLLVVYPNEPGLPRALRRQFCSISFLYLDYAIYRQDRMSGTGNVQRLFFSYKPTEEIGTPYDIALVFIPKGKELIEYAFSTVARLLKLGARALVVGPKKSGIRSSKNLAEQYIGPVVDSRSARHSRLNTIYRTVESTPSFEGQKKYSVSAWDHQIEVTTLPGVFSHGRLDDGTRYLLSHLDLPEWSKALDFGCGSGVLGALLLSNRPQTQVDLVDSNLMSLEASRRTLRANELHGRVYPSDIFSDVEGSYDLILSNPPFHQGLATDFSATNEFIRASGRHLTPNGRLVLVANTFIDYLTPLHTAFHDVEILCQSKRYRILEARTPRRPAGGVTLGKTGQRRTV